MKFSITKQSSSKPNIKSKLAQENTPKTNHEYLTEFDSSKTLTLDSAPKKLIIPPKENEWRPTKRMKNLELPPIHSGGKPLEFEIESSEIETGSLPGSEISYGLNVRQPPGINGKGELGNVNSVDTIMLNKLKTDLDKLPDDEGFDQFNEVPVEGFGAALLGGYGWKEGMGIGKNAKEDVKVVEYKRKSAKEGLGFMSDSGVPAKIGGDNGSDKGREKEGKVGNLRFGVGKEVRIVGGREMGLKGRVIEVSPGGELVVLKLSRGEKEVKVRVNDVAELGSLEEEKCLKKLKELEIGGKKDDARGGGRKGKDKSKDEGRRVRDERVEVNEDRGGSGNSVPWLMSHIRVRIISKSFKGGRFYLKKGEVIDVVGPTTCDISMDNGSEIVQGVEQDMLETALPRRGGPVLVLFGKHKGAYGSLVEKDTEREAGVVQDADTRELLRVRLEQIAEFVGDPSYIGY